MAVSLSLLAGAGWQFLDDNANPLTGGLLYTYAAGTTTPLATYTSSSGSTPNTNPIVLDAAGRVSQEVWLTTTSDYKFILKNSTGVTIWTKDDIPGGLSSDAVTFLQDGTGADERTVQSKLRDVVSVKDFGAVGNGIADDTAAVHEAFNYAVANQREVYFPAGTYRVTSGYTMSATYSRLSICGEGGSQFAKNDAIILLDNISASSFFLKITGQYIALKATGITFKCNQTVTDRKFFWFTGNHQEDFLSCLFTNVEKPFYFDVDSYFQNSSFINVTFVNSGTFYSVTGGSTNLRGTLMTIYNVNHEGGVPTNTDKIVCDLSAIRQIVADNFLLEGALPSAGWTILKLTNPYDAPYTRSNFAQFRNFHSEWAGAFSPAYSVDQINGNVQWNYIVGVEPSYPYKLSNLASVDISNFSFAGTTADPATYFVLENSQCVVRLTNCAARSFDPFNTSVLYRMTQVADINDGQGQVVIDSTDSSRAYKWTGGYVLADNVTSNFVPAGQSNYPATDATYGRKLVLVPDGAGGLNQNIVVPAVIKAGMQVTIMARMKLPTFASGIWAALNCDIGALNAIAYKNTADSGAVVDVQVTRVALADLTSITISFTNGTTPGATGGSVLEIYDLAIFVGSQIPRRLFPAYPKNITTYNSAVPTTGTWAVGDRVFNNTPAVGQPKSWVCTVAGTPGTWVSEGNL